MKVYLDNGATTQVDNEVARIIQTYLTEKYGNASSLHQFGRDAKEALESSREIIARKINAEPEEIIFTSCGSESNNTVLKGVALSKGKGHIITTKVEHPCILGTANYLSKKGFEITYLDVDKYGFINLEQLEKSIRKDTILVSIIHANNEIGTINDLEAIGKICKKYNVLFHSDCVQSLTKARIDVKKMNLSFASFSAHKLHAQKGVGALYIKKGIRIDKLIHGGHQENDFRAGTENIPGIAGFAKAVELAKEEYIPKMIKLRDKLIRELLKIPNTQLNGDGKKRLCNHASISFNFIEGEGLLMHLDAKGIAVSTGSACSSQSLTPSHVLIAIGLPHEIAHGTIRFTLSRFTTEKEIDYTLKTVKEVVKNLRKISPIKEGFVYNKEEYAHGH